jgi:hypothetical protein
VILLELFSQPHEWKEKKKTDNYHSYEFDAGGRLIVVEFSRSEKNDWEVIFVERKKNGDRLSTKVELTGSGDEFRVFGTVIEIIKYFLESVIPDSLYFTAEKSEGSRAKLYQKIVDKLATGKWQKEVDHKTSDYRSLFTIKPFRSARSVIASQK